ncbi:MAG: RsbRD N-terminal domain-containing protein, partial [Thermoanaerobaculia bacterium]
MTDTRWSRLAEVLGGRGQEVMSEWMGLQQKDLSLRSNLLKPGELEQQCRDFYGAFLRALASGGSEDVVVSDNWTQVREILTNLSRSRARQGFTPTETATFVFSLKQPLFHVLRNQLSAEELADSIWTLTLVLDRLGLFTTETYQKGREEVIARQQQELMELSTP